MFHKIKGIVHTEPAYPEQHQVDTSYQLQFRMNQRLAHILVASMAINLYLGWAYATQPGRPQPVLFRVDSGGIVRPMELPGGQWPQADEGERRRFLSAFVTTWRKTSLDASDLNDIGTFVERNGGPLVFSAVRTEFERNHPGHLIKSRLRRSAEIVSVTPTTPGNPRHYLVDWVEHLDHENGKRTSSTPKRARFEIEQQPYQEVGPYTFESPLGLRAVHLELIDLGGTSK